MTLGFFGKGIASAQPPDPWWMSPNNLQDLYKQMKKEMEDGLHRQSLGALYGGTAQQSSTPQQGTAAQFAAVQAQQRAYYEALMQSQYNSQLTRTVVATPEYEAVKYTGVRAGEIVAWRTWKVVDDWLHSQSADAIWAPGEAMEGDIKKHGCYAYKTKSATIKHALKEMRGSPCVLGSVQLWGEIVEHEIGYRSQFAKIASLDFIQNGNDDMLVALRARYSVP